MLYGVLQRKPLSKHSHYLKEFLSDSNVRFFIVPIATLSFRMKYVHLLFGDF